MVDRTFQEVGIFTVQRVVYLPSVVVRVLGNLKVAVGLAFNGASVAALMFALILLIVDADVRHRKAVGTAHAAPELD